MARAGRPNKEISKEEFEKLCGLQCTKGEIAGWFNCSEDTIERFCKKTYGESFAVVFDKKRGVGKISLRRTQWKLAEKSATMAIFLGKQYLDQSDKIEQTINGIDEQTRQTVGELVEGLINNDEGTSNLDTSENSI